MLNTFTAKKNNVKSLKRTGSNNLWKEILRNKYIYLIILPALAVFIIFKYMPMYGLTLAFKEYKPSVGIWGSPWVGLEHFRNMTINGGFLNALKNTVIISFLKILFGFPFPIILTLLIHELSCSKYPKVLQTVYTFPHFLSWIVISGMVFTLFSSDGVVNEVLKIFGLEEQKILLDPKSFRALIVISQMWKESGWQMILYLAAVNGIDRSLYAAARLDGANRFQQVIYITLPCILPMMVTNLILSCAYIMDGGFDQIFNMYNASVFEVADILDTYVYRISFQQTPDYGFSTAVGMFKSVTNLLLILTVNGVVKLFGQKGII